MYNYNAFFLHYYIFFQIYYYELCVVTNSVVKQLWELWCSLIKGGRRLLSPASYAGAWTGSLQPGFNCFRWRHAAACTPWMLLLSGSVRRTLRSAWNALSVPPPLFHFLRLGVPLLLHYLLSTPATLLTSLARSDDRFTGPAPGQPI